MQHKALVKKEQIRSRYQNRKVSWKPAAKFLSLLVIVIFGFFSIIATGGGGGSGTSSTTSSTGSSAVAGYSAPSEISAVPTSISVGQSVSPKWSAGLAAALKSMAYSDSGTDYSQTEVKNYIEEPALMQFSMIESVLTALNQTHYADAENIDAGAYKCMVAWSDEEDGNAKKTLQPWVVRSDHVVESGEDVLRARAWIEEQDVGETLMTKAEFKVYSPPTQNEDGSYADYGVWTMHVKFSDTEPVDDYFVATASVGDDGVPIVQLHSILPETIDGTVHNLDMRAIMHRSSTTGYGKVKYPKFELLFGPDGDPNISDEDLHKKAKYAYNTTYLAVKDGDNDVQYKDRTSVTEMTHRYGVFNNDTGQDVMKTKSFGFPIRYTESGVTKRGYYGAWQGRHQIWTQSEGGSVSEGTEVTREDTPPDQAAETYTVSKEFKGTLVKRTLVDADIEDIKNIPVEIWINSDFNMIYNSGEWKYCPKMNWDTNPPECDGTLKVFDDEIGFASLIVGANDNRKNVNINRWDNDSQQNKTYVYEAASAENENVAGFYEATQDNGKSTVNTPRVKLNPSDGDSLFVWMGGSIYVEYQGSGVWKEKELVGFDTKNWTPEFSDTGDKDYTLPLNKELYISMQGANYIVKRTGESTYETQFELQTAANPSNATTVVLANTIFKNQWNADGSSTYEFITDSGNTNYLMLLYKTIGDNDKDAQGNANAGVEVGAVVQSDIWGLQAYVNGEATTAMYNWEYKGANDSWGSVTYLKNADGTYKLLDDPMRFNSITAKNKAEEDKTLALQYDGWMMGLPDMHEELKKNSWTMTEDISNKIINLAAGTEVTDSETSTVYVLKPLEVSQFLEVVSSDTAGVPDITQADSIDLSTAPEFVEHGMGDMPEVSTVKYTEGKLVE